ncbi:MAG: energy transducer TonB [Candidatus Sulfotelmatobacter sp.]|jgi:protein TonB
MFERTLNSSWDERSRRGWMTLTSFGLQALAVGVLLVLPLLRPTGLPSLRQLSTPISLGQPMEEPPVAMTREGTNSTAPNTAEGIIRTPSRIPKGIAPDGGDTPPQLGVAGPAISGMGPGDPSGVRNLFENGSRPILPAVRPLPTAGPVRISHMSEGNLIYKVQPAYPALARAARIQGAVVLQAVISKQGAIENLKVLTGQPMLVPAAIEAVRQWRYRPYILNDQPVEVETQITVNFSLAGN